jgi:hypothetical protein
VFRAAHLSPKFYFGVKCGKPHATKRAVQKVSHRVHKEYKDKFLGYIFRLKSKLSFVLCGLCERFV